MRGLFMGTSEFAVESLKALIASEHELLVVVTQPDRPAGRGRRVGASPVKLTAQEAGLPILQPERVRSEEFVALVRDMSPDIIVVAAFGQIIPKAILDIPRFGNVNVHASLLPKYRGAAPVHHALMNGETVTGITTMLMDPGLDTGPILLQRSVDILPADNQGTLEARLARVGAELLLETLDGLEREVITPTAQDDAQATSAPSIKREDCGIDWTHDAESIVNMVRGCTPRPGVYSSVEGVGMKIISARIVDAGRAGSPGEVLEVSPDGILVQAGHGAVMVGEVQPESGRRMAASDFARGRSIRKGTILANS